MSFNPPKSQDLKNLIEKLDPPYRIRENLLFQVTIGYPSLLNQIRHQESEEKKTSDSDRYTLEELIGYGNFSNVYRANTLNSPVKYALKVIFPEVSLLGFRELTFLRYLNAKVPMKSPFFVRISESFCYDGKLTLVMKCYNGTLMAYIDPNPSGYDLSVSTSISSQTAVSSLVRPKSRTMYPVSLESTIQKPFTPTINERFLYHLRKFTSKLFATLWILRMEGVIHCDIKPENIFILSSLSSSDFSSLSSSLPNQPLSASKKMKSSHQPVMDLGLVSQELDYVLGDFGNAFLFSEATKFYKDFNSQSLPYRAPEVVCGVPFNYQVDLWSVGIILLEIILGKTLFSCLSREELFIAQCQVLTPPHFTRFASGKYSRDLFSLLHSDSSDSSIRVPHPLPQSDSPPSFSDHQLKIRNLIKSSVSSERFLFLPPDLFHLIASLLYPDPDIRLSIQDAVQHSFISSTIAIPPCLWPGNKVKGRGNQRAESIRNLRKKSLRTEEDRNPSYEFG